MVQVTLTRKGEDLPGIKELEFSPMDHHLRVTVLVRALALIDVPARLGRRPHGVAGLCLHTFSRVGFVMLRLPRVCKLCTPHLSLWVVARVYPLCAL